MRKLLIHLTILTALPVSVGYSQSAPNCIGKFQNQSNYEWSISNFDGRKGSLVIPPNTTADIAWGTTSEITVGANIPNRSFAKKFSVQVTGSCVTILHQGPTGGLLLNKPNNGDITTCTGGC